MDGMLIIWKQRNRNHVLNSIIIPNTIDAIPRMKIGFAGRTVDDGNLVRICLTNRDNLSTNILICVLNVNYRERTETHSRYELNASIAIVIIIPNTIDAIPKMFFL